MGKARFTRYNQPDIVCYCCGRRTTRDAGSGTDLCGRCYDSAGEYNAHTDTQGDHYGMGKQADCPTCNNVECLHELGVRKAR